MEFLTLNNGINSQGMNRVRNNIIYFLTSFLIITLSCNFVEPPDENIVITVGDTSISRDELREDIERVIFEMGITDQDAKIGIKSIVDKVIEKKLILEYGKIKGIYITDEELDSAVIEIKNDYPEDIFNEMLLKRYLDLSDWKDDFKEELLIKKIIEEVVSEFPPVTYDETKEYYDEHQDEFRHPKMVKLRHILTKTREEIDNVLALIDQGHEIGKLAEKHSIAPEAEEKGMLGWIAQGELDEMIDNFIFSLKMGEISGVLESPYGYHIFEVQEVKNEGIKTFPETIKEIESKITLRKKELIFRRWLDNLRSRFSVSVKENEIYSEWGMEG
ncbi:peptidyl-prolyl cis-trans isomerase [Thermodesulfobacteriota bacterium]